MLVVLFRFVCCVCCSCFVFVVLCVCVCIVSALLVLFCGFYVCDCVLRLSLCFVLMVV